MHTAKFNQQQKDIPCGITYAMRPEDMVPQATNLHSVSHLLVQVDLAQLLQRGTGSFSSLITREPTFEYPCQPWVNAYPWKPTSAINASITTTKYALEMINHGGGFSINAEALPRTMPDAYDYSTYLDQQQQQLSEQAVHLLLQCLLSEPAPMQNNREVPPLSDGSPQELVNAHESLLSNGPETKGLRCQYCHEVISEHPKNVKRHEQGCSKRDPQERPVFKCKPCDKSFTRPDSLKRHWTSKAHSRFIR